MKASHFFFVLYFPCFNREKIGTKEQSLKTPRGSGTLCVPAIVPDLQQGYIETCDSVPNGHGLFLSKAGTKVF